MLNIDGKRVMEVCNITPGPKIGFILHALLEEVLDNPNLNTKDYLEDRAKKLSKLKEEDLEKLGKKGREKKEEIEEEEISLIRKKHWVK